MRDHHSYETISLGGSDVAALICVGCHKETEMTSDILHFGEDNCYRAYLVDSDCEIPTYYNKVFQYDYWMKIYDDRGLVFKSEYGMHINIFRAGELGVIIQQVKED